MKKLRDIIPTGLAAKLIRFVVIFVLILGLVFITMSRVQVRLLKGEVRSEEEKRSELIEGEYQDSMTEYVQDSLLQLNIWAADKTDDEFWIIIHDMRSLGSQVADVFKHPEKYERITVNEPIKENTGKFALQILYGNGAENADPKTMDMVGRLANLAPMMEEMIRHNEGYTLDLYISTPDDVTLAMDNLSGGKFDENGNIKEYVPTERPWYQGAVENGDIYISSAVHSFFYDLNEVVFGYPVYVDGKLVAVLEASTQLGVIEKKMNDRNVGEDGFSVLISTTGQLVCSQRKDGELKLRDDLSEDIRGSVNNKLKEVIGFALDGKEGVNIVSVDGELFFAAYAPLLTIGWTQITFASVKEMMEPTAELLGEMEESTDDMIKTLDKDFRRHSVFLVIGLFVFLELAIIMASQMAKKRVQPIHKMTEAVGSFVGDDMEFEMEDVYKTGDEIQVLAESFEIMSRKMKDYVTQIVENTAEKERMEAEMEAASQIQFKMLPTIEPDFSGKPRYELFAAMSTARQVGGDLYDFYYLDEDRLVMMIGDVSGKGITAALFMSLCKQMIKSYVLLHNGDIIAAMNEANKRLCEESADAMFVTVWLGVLTLSTGELNFVNAGHMYAAVKRGDAEFALEEDVHCLLMGAIKFATYKINTTRLNPGDAIYLYTDGVTEAHVDVDSVHENLFGEARMLEALNEMKDSSMEELDNNVRKRVSEFTKGAEQYDDMTTLCFRYLGKEN